MNSTLTYKGLIARIDFSAEDEAFIGRIAGIDDDIAFRGTSVPELMSAFHEAADDYLATCATLGKKPGKAHSGKIMLRVDPEIHTQVALAAELAGKSLNQWAEEVLRVAVSNQVHPDLAPEPQPAAPSNPEPKVVKVLKRKPANTPGFLPKATPAKAASALEILAQRQGKKG